jgi:hypothetical protein
MLKANLARTLCGFAILILSVGGTLAIAAAPSATIEVSAPDRDYRDYPITVEISAPPSAKSVLLLEQIPGQTVAPQLWREGEKAMVTLIVPQLKKGSTLSYKLAFGEAAPASADGVEVRKGEGAVEVLIGGKLFTRYVTADGPKPYCYPLMDAAGAAVTRDFPMKKVEAETKLKDNDHPHHRSLWFTHGDVNGIDFWSESAKAGKTVHRTFEAVEGGPATGRIRAVTDWVAPDGKKVCEDTREIRFYKVAAGRLFDYDVTVKATEGPVKFGDTKEGMFGFRVASTMKADAKKMDPKIGGAIVNSEGLKDGDAWGKPAAWVDYCGPIEGKTVGIAVFNHPSSFRFPTYWHVRTYGLFAANPFGIHDFPNGKGKDGSHAMAKGDSITFRYRILIHSGTTEEAKIAQIGEQYANPPKVAVK